MTRIVALNRRQMIAASLGGAALALGMATPAIGAALQGGDAASAGAAIDIQPLLSIWPDGRVNIVAVLSDMGQGVSTALPLILAEELDADWATVTILPYRSGMPTPPITDPGMMMAADSRSVRSWFTPLRECGARARAMLVEAAAQRWKVAASDCTTAKSWVLHPNGRDRLSYGALAQAAALLPPPKDVVLKPLNRFSLVGKHSDRHDVPEKCTGAAIYASDVKLPGLLYASITQGPLGGSELVSWDEKAALALPRVKRLFVIEGSTLVALAEDSWSAMRALETAAPVFKPKAQGTGTEAYAAALKTAISTPGRAFGEVGTKPAKDTGLTRITAEYALPFLAHATMEPMSCTAWFKGDSYELWSPSQSIFAAHKIAAATAGLPEDKVVLHQTLLGGGFGRRSENDFVRQAVLIAREIKGAPVRITWSRSEDMQHDYYRPAFAMRYSGAIAKDGSIADYRVTTAGGSILRTRSSRFDSPDAPIDPTVQSGLIPKFYRLPNAGAGWVEVLPPIRIGFWRSVAHSQNVFAAESFIDELAHAAKRDPFTFRQELITDPRMAAVLAKLRTLSGWDTPVAKGRARGVAVVFCYGSYLGQVVECSLSGGEIKLHRMTQVVDCGLAVQPGNVVAQIDGGAIFGMSAALYGEITATDGVVAESSFSDYRVLTLGDVPPMTTFVVPSEEPPTGVGETGTPATAPALANALFALTGKRIRTLPLAKAFAA